MSELSKLLTFMFKEDRSEIIQQYNEMLDNAEDEQAMLESFGSPTRLAVAISRSYQRDERKLSVHADSKDGGSGEAVKVKPVIPTQGKKSSAPIVKPNEPAADAYVDIIEEIRREKAAEEGIEYKPIFFKEEPKPAEPGDVVLEVENLTVASRLHKNDAVKNVSFKVRKGEIVCIAGIDGNGQTELVYGITGLEHAKSGSVKLNGVDITHASIRKRNTSGMSHIPEDRHKHGLVLDYSLEYNLILQTYFGDEFTDKAGFLKRKAIREYADRLIGMYDIRSGQGAVTSARSMSGGNQQKAIIAREIDKSPDLLVAVQPTRGLDVGAIEYIHKQLIAQRDAGKACLLISLELDEVMDIPDRILVMYEGEIVGEFDPKNTTQDELGLYMAGAKRSEVHDEN